MVAEPGKFSLDTPLDLDSSLDDIEDLPGFSTWPSGAYHVVLAKGMEQKEINEKAAIEVAMTLVDITEMSGQLDLGEDPPKAGDICSVAYFLNNKVALNNLKKEWLKPLASLGSTIRQIADATKGLNLLVVVTRVPDKTDPDKKYCRIKKVALL